MKIAIVGSEEKHWAHWAKQEVMEKITEILSIGSDVVLVSGGCHKGGVDIWAEAIAIALGLEKEIYLPDEHVWSISSSDRKGFRERNIEIAEACDELHCFDPLEREWSGGMWTMNYAKKSGKRVYHHKS